MFQPPSASSILPPRLPLPFFSVRASNSAYTHTPSYAPSVKRFTKTSPDPGCMALCS
ncbi:hypothetical protein HYPSUDRAFT_68547 [Hypholoma sublateritium FD-334 SS-4]|uniref:Uncharacterized protein n=1 Tax=Hypholoma sublateritium (strain FD-334 SS-4) TaxID=945553 RepID=A0A0D2L0Y9_HYPSF|nr:hypothetical protein HYPSUDRAFT_68547 [Hypholoma sublateritium FD-334 SS-4]